MPEPVTIALRDIASTITEREAHDPLAYPADSIRDLYDARVIPGPLPSERGGLGWSLPDSTRAVFELAQHSPSAALIAAMPMGLAGVYGIDASFVPKAWATAWAEQADWASGEFAARRLFAACNSERGAGGSLAATKTEMSRRPDGSFAITGEKILASGGTNASWFFSTAKTSPEDIPGGGVVEFFFVPGDGEGVEVLSDWDGFGMRSTESQTVRYAGARSEAFLGFPNFIDVIQPLGYWYCLFAAIPLGCTRAILDELSQPAPAGAGLRLRLSDALMRIEALEAYLFETASQWRPAAGPAFMRRVVRTKTYVAQESTKLAAELFALAGGRHYRSEDRLARLLADSFAGTALRPPLALALETMIDQFGQ